jgi:hypothetical protein
MLGGGSDVGSRPNPQLPLAVVSPADHAAAGQHRARMESPAGNGGGDLAWKRDGGLGAQ